MPRRMLLGCYEGRETSLRTCFKNPQALERIISRRYRDESSARPLPPVQVAKWLERDRRSKRKWCDEENMKRVSHFLLRLKNRLVNLGSVLKLWRSPDAESLSSMLGHQPTWNRRWTRSQSYFCLSRAWWVVSHGIVNGLIAKSKVTNVVISWQLKSTVALMKFLVKGADAKRSGDFFKGANRYWRLLSCLACFMLECSCARLVLKLIWRLRTWKCISRNPDLLL